MSEDEETRDCLCEKIRIQSQRSYKNNADNLWAAQVAWAVGTSPLGTKTAVFSPCSSSFPARDRWWLPRVCRSFPARGGRSAVLGGCDGVRETGSWLLEDLVREGRRNRRANWQVYPEPSFFSRNGSEFRRRIFFFDTIRAWSM